MLIRLGGVFLVVGLALWLWALFDALFTPAERIRLMPKGIWVILILLFTTVGALGWFLLGRPRTALRVAVTRRAAAPVAPDDDPEFLRRLAEDVRRRRDEPR